MSELLALIPRGLLPVIANDSPQDISLADLVFQFGREIWKLAAELAHHLCLLRWIERDMRARYETVEKSAHLGVALRRVLGKRRTSRYEEIIFALIDI